jgi:hypothetical protein
MKKFSHTEPGFGTTRQLPASILSFLERQLLKLEAGVQIPSPAPRVFNFNKFTF